jgi:hypothetical protein
MPVPNSLFPIANRWPSACAAPPAPNNRTNPQIGIGTAQRRSRTPARNNLRAASGCESNHHFTAETDLISRNP